MWGNDRGIFEEGGQNMRALMSPPKLSAKFLSPSNAHMLLFMLFRHEDLVWYTFDKDENDVNVCWKIVDLNACFYLITSNYLLVFETKGKKSQVFSILKDRYTITVVGNGSAFRPA